MQYLLNKTNENSTAKFNSITAVLIKSKDHYFNEAT